MLTDGIKFKNFKFKKNYNVERKFNELINKKNHVLDSLRKK